MAVSQLLLTLCVATLAPAASINGRVWIANLNEPLPEAHVSLLREPSGAKVAEVHSGDDGRYQFADVPTGKYQVLIEAPGWRNLRLHSVDVAAEVVTLPSLEPELSGTCPVFGPMPMNDRAVLPDKTKTALTGTVDGSQRPPQVVLFQYTKRIATVKPDATGKFEFPNLTPGDYQIQIRRFGYRTINAIYEKVPAGFEIFSDFQMTRCPDRICAFPVPPAACDESPSY